jgi:hypothetical protein
VLAEEASEVQMALVDEASSLFTDCRVGAFSEVHIKHRS